MGFIRDYIEGRTEKAKRENPYAEGTRYHDMFEKNPYTAETFTRDHTMWDSLANAFGFRSGYDAAYDEWMKAGNEYDAQIEQIKGEDEYNSEQAKAARMRAAGQNPDLLGTESASEAAEFAQEQTSPNVNAHVEEAESMNGFITGIVQTIMGGMSITREIASTMGLFQELQTKKLTNAGKIEELADKFLVNYTPDRKKNFENDEALRTAYLEGYMDLFAENNHLNRKQNAQFQNAVRARYQSRMGELYDRDTKNLESRRKYGLVRGSKYSTTDDETDKVLKVVSDAVDHIDKTWMNSLKYEHYKSTNNMEYEAERDGKIEGEAFNKQNEAAGKKAELQNAAKKAVDEAVKELEPYVKDGNLLALALQSALPGLYLKFFE